MLYDFDGFRLVPNEARLTFRGAPVKLTAKAAAVLALLAERSPEVVSRAEFEAAVWPEGFIEPANLTQTIYMLRRALGRFASLVPIETVNGRGYRLCAAVHRKEAAPRFGVNRTLLRPHLDWRIVASVAVLFALVALFGAARIAYALHPPASSTTAAGGAAHPQAAPAKSF
jgi:DNA-binding winged helix-turn-helix (wHTH) protein